MQGFLFEFCHTGVSGAESDGLEDTQQAGGTDGKVAPQIIQIDNRCTCDVIPQILIPKSVYSHEIHA